MHEEWKLAVEKFCSRRLTFNKYLVVGGKLKEVEMRIELI